MKVLVWKNQRTDPLTLAITELSFRKLIGQYALALALPYPSDIQALANLGSQLAKEMYGLEISPDDLLALMNVAIALCEQDYKIAIDYTIEQIKNHL